MSEKEIKKGRGGPDRNQGRKLKYPNGSKTIRVPNELVEKVETMITNYKPKKSTS